MSEILAPWPQLLKIFSDYLECSEAIKANVVSRVVGSYFYNAFSVVVTED